MIENQNIKFIYFGGEPLSVPVLDALKLANLLPAVIICNPDRPSGRGGKLAPPPAKIWAEKNNIPVCQPEKINDDEELLEILNREDWDLFVVVAYNKILPNWLIDKPKFKTVNLHPSLLPKLRGASPIRTAILEDKRDAVGVSVMVLDEKMDSGPILAQVPLAISDQDWPIDGRELDTALAKLGGAELAATIPLYLTEKLIPLEQDHLEATYCGRLDKTMGELKLDPHDLPLGDDAYSALLKIKAFAGFPGTFFWHEGKRIKITNAELAANGQLRIVSIIPEGKKETSFTSFFRN